ncbi:DNA sulfur modification protein DndB [Nocardia sp. CA2R105]|uniref:DNA sulfur modification protein DndB n=1 Tax=Nocardia coffeae TaxID=2873381 RepID=UPI001CA797B0|nr:DNA sulfur modification protein DndB [Nocardia coffeae]MBY8855381.1 DNA sulfur modification protein DndB [Nocardia coffeae]
MSSETDVIMKALSQNLIEHPDLDAARKAARDTAESSHGRAFPCTVFVQGTRTMISTALEFASVRQLIVMDSAVKGESPRKRTNRPLLPDHVRAIRDYVAANRDDYVLPPVTLNAREIPALHVVRGNTAIKCGFMVVVDSTKFYITDGQHRIAAITGHHVGKTHTPGLVHDEDGAFASDGLAVVIIIEEKLPAIQQDFADAARTKSLPLSLLAAFNTREPINRVLTRIVDESPFLEKRVDETSKSLSKGATSLFLLNQIRGLVKEILVGDYAISEDALSRHTQRLLASKADQDAFVEDTLLVLDTLVRHMDPWRSISGIASDPQLIPKLRAEYINMTATGLVLIGRAVHEINKVYDRDARIGKYVELATAIDWRRSAAIWRGTVVVADSDESSDSKIVTLRGAVNGAYSRMKQNLQMADGAEAE